MGFGSRSPIPPTAATAAAIPEAVTGWLYKARSCSSVIILIGSYRLSIVNFKNQVVPIILLTREVKFEIMASTSNPLKLSDGHGMEVEIWSPESNLEKKYSTKLTEGRLVNQSPPQLFLRCVQQDRLWQI